MAAEPGYVAASITVDRLDSKYDLVLNPNTNGYTPNRLYGWTCSSQSITFWTSTPTPTTSSKLYNEHGIVQDVTTYADGGFWISEIVSDDNITVKEAI